MRVKTNSLYLYNPNEGATMETPMLVWNDLGLCTRYAILGVAQLPVKLAFCHWSQLSQGERDALHFVDWFKVIEYVSKDHTA